MFRGYFGPSNAANSLTLLNLPKDCKLEIFKYLDTTDLASLCAADKSLIEPAVFCFNRDRGAEYELDYCTFGCNHDIVSSYMNKKACCSNLYNAKTVISVFRYFGPSLKKLTDSNSGKECHTSGSLVLKLVMKHCSEALESFDMTRMTIDCTNYRVKSKLRLLELLMNVKSWNFSSSKLSNCGFLFEHYVNSITSLTLDNTRMDKSTKDKLVRKYPNLEALTVREYPGYVQNASHQRKNELKKLIRLNRHVKHWTLDQFSWMRQQIFDGHDMEKLTLTMKRPAILGLMPNLHTLEIRNTSNFYWSVWRNSNFLDQIQQMPSLTTFSLFIHPTYMYLVQWMLADLMLTVPNVHYFKVIDFRDNSILGSFQW